MHYGDLFVDVICDCNNDDDGYARAVRVAHR